MHDLRLIGVHEDGDHLLLADAEGTRYRLPLDEPLRAAARRDRPRLGQLQIEIDGGLRPRDVQALIRSGLSAAEVADRSGWTLEKVRKFEGPVLAEREFMAGRARAAVLDLDKGGRETLEERATARLRNRGVDAAAIEWDSLRHDSGHWVVTVTFPAGGRQRTASWRFDPQSSQLRAQNDDARWLGEDERGGPLPTPHVAGDTTAQEQVFDVDSSMRSSRRPTSALPHLEEDELTESLRAHHSSLRARRGRRRSGPSSAPGEHLAPVAALPLVPLVGDADELGPPPDRPRADAPDLEPATDAHSEGPEGPEAREAPETAERVAAAEPPKDVPQPSEGSAPDESARPKGRRSVPSWDDVVFGTRSRPTPPAD